MPSYDFFTQPQGPNIDIDLFPRARLLGAQTGNISKTPVQAGIEGLIEGVETGMDLFGKYQTAEIRQNQIEQQPIENEIRRQQLRQEQIQTQAAEIESQAIENNKTAILLTKDNQARTALKESETKLEDANNINEIMDLLSSGSLPEKERILKDPKYSGTLFRDNKLSLQVLGNLESSGADPDLLKKARATYDAIELQKERAKFIQDQKEAQAAFAQKQYEKYVPALGYLQSSSNEFNKITQEPNFNPNNLKIYKKGEVTVDESGRIKVDPLTKRPVLSDIAVEGNGYLLAYGDRVLDNNIPESEGSTFRKNLDDYKSYNATKFPSIAGTTPQVTKQDKPAVPQGDVNSFGQPAATPNGTPTPVPSGQNAKIIQDAKARNDAAQKQALKTGQTSYNAMLSQGKNMVRAAASESPVSYLSSNQSTPVNPKVPPITTPVFTPSAITAPKDLDMHLSNVLGGASVETNLKLAKLPISTETINRVESLPGMSNKPAIFKGLVAVESGGKVNAISPVGAVGPTQLMEGAAKDVGLSSADRFDPVKNIEGGEDYLQKKYTEVEKTLKYELGKQGLPVKVDPRFVLAAYNGGLRDVKAGLNKGITSWDEMSDFLKSRKGKKQGEENTSYPDKVLAASIPFIKGGNASDEDYLRTLIAFDIIRV